MEVVASRSPVAALRQLFFTPFLYAHGTLISRRGFMGLTIYEIRVLEPRVAPARCLI